VFIGHDVRIPGDMISVFDMVRYKGGSGFYDRPLLLHLVKDVPAFVEPRSTVETARLDEVFSGRVVGFGYADMDNSVGAGVKRTGLVPIKSHRCKGSYQSKCTIGVEMVAGGKVDTCKGDSGGPLLVRSTEGDWQLAGITSRGLDPLSPDRCGNGGIYMRADTIATWLTQKTRR
jgi:hypothetical protein